MQTTVLIAVLSVVGAGVLAFIIIRMRSCMHQRELRNRDVEKKPLPRPPVFLLRDKDDPLVKAYEVDGSDESAYPYPTPDGLGHAEYFDYPGAIDQGSEYQSTCDISLASREQLASREKLASKDQLPSDARKSIDKMQRPQPALVANPNPTIAIPPRNPVRKTSRDVIIEKKRSRGDIKKSTSDSSRAAIVKKASRETMPPTSGGEFEFDESRTLNHKSSKSESDILSTTSSARKLSENWDEEQRNTMNFEGLGKIMRLTPQSSYNHLRERLEDEDEGRESPILSDITKTATSTTS